MQCSKIVLSLASRFLRLCPQYPYQLHAVLVHEGQAVSGHYWAYIKSRRHDKWLKFNDITVTDATWEELQRESIGGYHNTSAYCLMYVDNNNEQLLDGGSPVWLFASCSAEFCFLSLHCR